MSYINRIIAKFVLKIPNFRQERLSDVYFNGTVNNSRISISCISRVLADFVSKKTSVGCHGNKGRSEANLDDAVKLPNPENPTFGTNSSLLSLKMPELLSFEVTIGLNANFHILGEKRGKCENSSSRPPKGISLRVQMYRS